MTALSESEILRKIYDDGLVQNYKYLGPQLQPCSFDLTVNTVFDFTGPGVIDYDNSQRIIANITGHELVNGEWHLNPGYYKVRFNEIVRLPKDLCAITATRSSLARCGAQIHVGFWDAGYIGAGEALLTVGNPAGIILKKDAKIAQMIFIKLSIPVTDGYKGKFQGENIKL